jgi:hypothetical protein
VGLGLRPGLGSEEDFFPTPCSNPHDTVSVSHAQSVYMFDRVEFAGMQR